MEGMRVVLKWSLKWSGEHGGRVQSLEHALGDSKFVVLEERCVGRRERKK